VDQRAWEGYVCIGMSLVYTVHAFVFFPPVDEKHGLVPAKSLAFEKFLSKMNTEQDTEKASVLRLLCKMDS
jgi:hypothetical protein